MNVAFEAVLLLVAAALCAIAAISSRPLRLVVQVLLITTAVFVGIAGSAAIEDLLIAGTLLVAITFVSTSFSTEFRHSGQAEREAREDAERRSELLEAVRPLPELDLRGAAQVTTAALRAFGSVAAGVVVVHGDRIVPIDLNGVPPIDRLLRVGEGVSGRAVAAGRTLVFHNYQELPDRFDHLPELRSTVSTPIRVGDEVIGAVMAAQHQAGRPTDGQIEVAEVLAAHLGAVMATRRQLENRRMLLERMDRLDAMRGAFVEEVSEELRDPLTIIQGAGHTLRRHGEELRYADRQLLLSKLCSQADELRAVVDALLDFSRVQAAHREPALRDVTVGELFTSFGNKIRFDGSISLDTEVVTDVTLVRHAVELLVGDRGCRVTALVRDTSVAIEFLGQDRGRPVLVRSLVEQLAVEAGGSLRFLEVPTLILPRPDPAGEVP